MAKTVLVTGASSGTGEELVKRPLAADYDVHADARRVDRMRPLPLDLTDGSLTPAVEPSCAPPAGPTFS